MVPLVWNSPVDLHNYSLHIIPFQTSIYIPLTVIGRLPQFFPEPESFMPERWSKENSKKPPSFAFLPFGFGPRICPGESCKLNYHIAGKFSGELNLAVWWIDQPTTKLKSANIKSFIVDISRCGLWVVAAVFGNLCLCRRWKQRFPVTTQWIEPSLWRNRAQAADIFLGTHPTVVRSWSIATAYCRTQCIVSSCSACASAKCRAGACLGWAWSSARLKSTNIFVSAGFGQSAKFNSRQIFRLYGMPYSKSHLQTET